MATDLSSLLEMFKVGPTPQEKSEAGAHAMARMGLGILAANRSGPTLQVGRPTIGNIMGQGGLLGMDAYQNQLKYLQDERKAGGLAALQAMQIKKMMAQADMRKRLSGAGQEQSPATQALALGAAQGDIGPTNTNAQRLEQIQKSGPLPFIPSLQLLKEAADAELNIEPYLKLMERAQPKGEHIPGVGLVNPYTGAPVASFPRITDTGRAAGLVPDGNGGWKVEVPSGSVSAYTQFQRADEEEKARFDPFLGQVDPSGRPIPQTRLQFAQGVGSATDPAPSGPRQGMGPTPTQASAARTAGEGDARRVLDLEGKIPSLLSVQRRLARMSQLTADDATYAAAGAELKSGLGSIVQAFGLKVSEGKTANTEEYLAHVAELLKDRLASKDYGSGTGISNLDLLAARAPLPELAKTPLGRQQIIQAINSDAQRSLTDAVAARDYFSEKGSLRGFRWPSEGERAPIPKEPGSPPKQGTTFNTLPPAKDFKGKTVRDTQTGKLLRSDGMIWKEVK